MWQLLCLLLSEIKNMLPIKLQLSPCISKQMFGSHEYMGVNTKSNVFMLQCTVHAELLSSLWSNYILNGVTDLCFLFPSSLSDWKPVSVHVFGMKHLWDVHFLLLLLLCLFGAVTSQVNPGMCHHRRGNFIFQVSGFGRLYSHYTLTLQDSTIKWLLWVLGSVFFASGAAVRSCRLQLVQVLDKCRFVGALWSPRSGLASLITACTSFSSSPSAVRVVFGLSMKRDQ